MDGGSRSSRGALGTGQLCTVSSTRETDRGSMTSQPYRRAEVVFRLSSSACPLTGTCAAGWTPGQLSRPFLRNLGLFRHAGRCAVSGSNQSALTSLASGRGFQRSGTGLQRAQGSWTASRVFLGKTGRYRLRTGGRQGDQVAPPKGQSQSQDARPRRDRDRAMAGGSHVPSATLGPEYGEVLCAGT